MWKWWVHGVLLNIVWLWRLLFVVFHYFVDVLCMYSQVLMCASVHAWNNILLDFNSCSCKDQKEWGQRQVQSEMQQVPLHISHQRQRKGREIEAVTATRYVLPPLSYALFGWAEPCCTFWCYFNDQQTWFPNARQCSLSKLWLKCQYQSIQYA